MNQFNRIFRILWSKTKEQWVVTSELEGPGGKKQGKGLVSVFCAALIAAGMLSAAPQESEAMVGFDGFFGGGPPLASVICTGAAVSVTTAIGSGQCNLGGTDSLTVANTGSIHANSSSVIGVLLSGPTGSGVPTGVNITNSGTISLGRGTVIRVIDGTGTSILNQASGSIQVLGAGTANGIEYRPIMGVAASIINNGSISLVAKGAIARGINALAVVDGSITNTGSISVSQPSGSGATAYAIKTGSNVAGSVDNSGTINASVNVNSSSSSLGASAAGIKLGSSVSGSVTNSGDIIASVVGTTAATSSSIIYKAFGIQGLLDIAGVGSTLSNSGNITASVTNSGGAPSSITLSAQGIIAKIGTSATVTNSGTVATSVINSGSAGTTLVVNATGVSLQMKGGVFNNTGNVTATTANTGIGGSSSVERAIGADLIFTISGGVFNNSGTISGSSGAGDAISYSIYNPTATGVGGAINNQVGGVLKGNILIADAAVPLDNAGTIELPVGTDSTAFPGSAEIASTYSQQSGGKITFSADSAISYAKLTTGPANLIAGSVIDVYTTPTNTLAAGDVLTGVLTSSALTAGALTVTDNSSTLDFTVTVNGNAIDLTAIATAAAPTTPTPIDGSSDATVGTSKTADLPCLTPTTTGLLPMFATLLVGLGIMRRRKK